MSKRSSISWMMVAFVTAATCVLMAPTAGTPPTQTPWGYSVGTPFVPLGSNLSLLVWGPYDGVLNVTVNVQPFNSTYPVYGQNFNLSTGNVVPPDGVPVYRNVTIPMVNLYAGTVRLCVTTDTEVVLGCPLIYLTLGNVSALQASLQWEELNWTILTYREQSLFNNEQNLEGQIEIQFWVSVVLWAIIIFAVVVTRTNIAEKRLSRAIRRFFHGLLWGPPHVEFETGLGSPKVYRPPANPKRVFRGKAFPSCEECRIDHTEVAIVTHLRRDHSVDSPQRPLDYDIYRPSVKAARAKDPTLEPSEGVLRDHIDQIHVDFSDLGGRL
jgi:hypothetical protein